MGVAVVSEAKTPSSAEEYIPERSYDLIQRLAEIYSPRCILPNETPEEAHRFAGAVDLVNQLLDWKAHELGIETALTERGDARTFETMELPLNAIVDD